MESLSNAIYASNWADVAISKRLKAGIILLMQKSQEGQNFIAGKIYIVNMPNFVSVNKSIKEIEINSIKILYFQIVQLAFSFYTLMRSFNK